MKPTAHTTKQTKELRCPTDEERAMTRLRAALRSAMDHSARAYGQSVLTGHPPVLLISASERARLYQAMETLLREL